MRRALWIFLSIILFSAPGRGQENSSEPDVSQAASAPEINGENESAETASMGSSPAAPGEEESTENNPQAPSLDKKTEPEPPPSREVIGRIPSGSSRTLRYRGKLSDFDGSPMTGNYLLLFKLRDSSNLRRVLWREYIYVPTNSGIYRAVLGHQRSLPADFSSTAYRLTVEVPRGTGWILGKLPYRAAPRAAGKCGSSAVRFYRVETGDTLESIAEKLCGNNAHWMDLYLENYDRIQRGGDLVPGQVLIVPTIKDEVR